MLCIDLVGFCFGGGVLVLWLLCIFVWFDVFVLVIGIVIVFRIEFMGLVLGEEWVCFIVEFLVGVWFVEDLWVVFFVWLWFLFGVICGVVCGEILFVCFLVNWFLFIGGGFFMFEGFIW